MKSNRAFGTVVVTCVVTFALFYGSSATSKTTDQSDIWWVHTESGWGIQFVQNDNTIFATLFVYGPDGQPTWYSATLSYQSSLTWSGTLYKTSGPWFGTVPFNPAIVTVNPVGSMSLSAPLTNQATLIYTVNDVQMTKTIERQLLVYEKFGGTYSGVMSQQGAGLNCNPAANTNTTPVSVQITQNTPAMTVVATTNGDTCTYSGTYTQGGHFGRVAGNYSCSSGDTGTFTIFEMARSWYEFRARTSLVSQTGCTLKGFLAGLIQPPPTQ